MFGTATRFAAARTRCAAFVSDSGHRDRGSQRTFNTERIAAELSFMLESPTRSSTRLRNERSPRRAPADRLSGEGRSTLPRPFVDTPEGRWLEPDGGTAGTLTRWPLPSGFMGDDSDGIADHITLQVARYRRRRSPPSGSRRSTCRVRVNGWSSMGSTTSRGHLDGTLSYRWSCRMGISAAAG